MRSTPTFHAPPALHADSPNAPRTLRLRRRLGVLGGVLFVLAALVLLFGTPSPGRAIRTDLAAAAAAVRALPANAPAETVQKAVHAAFEGRSIAVDSGEFPAAVAVTLRGLDHKSCVDAAKVARRLEGKVVVQLEGYRSSDECGASNDMTWRIMP